MAAPTSWSTAATGAWGWTRGPSAAAGVVAMSSWSNANVREVTRGKRGARGEAQWRLTSGPGVGSTLQQRRTHA